MESQDQGVPFFRKADEKQHMAADGYFLMLCIFGEKTHPPAQPGSVELIRRTARVWDSTSRSLLVPTNKQPANDFITLKKKTNIYGLKTGGVEVPFFLSMFVELL